MSPNCSKPLRCTSQGQVLHPIRLWVKEAQEANWTWTDKDHNKFRWGTSIKWARLSQMPQKDSRQTIQELLLITQVRRGGGLELAKCRAIQACLIRCHQRCLLMAKDKGRTWQDKHLEHTWIIENKIETGWISAVVGVNQWKDQPLLARQAPKSDS